MIFTHIIMVTVAPAESPPKRRDVGEVHSCSLTMDAAKRTLDSYELIRNEIPPYYLASDDGIAAFTDTRATGKVDDVIRTFGFVSLNDWYQCFVEIVDAYVALVSKTQHMDIEGPLDEDWTTSEEMILGSIRDNVLIVEALTSDQRYSKLLSGSVSSSD